MTVPNTTTTPANTEATSEETTTTSNDNNNAESSSSLAVRYQKAIDLTESSPNEAVDVLESMQQEIARLALFSSNETIEDITTKSIPLLSLEHYLALAYSRIPTPPNQIQNRRSNLRRSIDLWNAFLHKLELLSSESSSSNDNNSNDVLIMTPQEQKEFLTLVECSNNNAPNDNSSTTGPLLPPQPNRDEKIARFKAKQMARKEVERLSALKERRIRLGIAPNDLMDELDEETLDRNVAMTSLLLNKAEALEEWASTIRELPMIERMISMQQQQQSSDKSSSNSGGGRQQPTRRPPAPANGLQVTHITLDASNQLQFRREEVKSQVFRPGWNQPTMSLDEFAHRERADAIQRDAKQKAAEQAGSDRPRRYEQLVRDGQEDNADAVDASAAVDRAWDDWKDENPRGSGNKRGDQGDRNF